MDFPDYVPPAVRAHIAAMIGGDHWESYGWAKALAETDKDVSALTAAMQVAGARGAVADLDRLRKQFVAATKHREQMKGNIDCLLRLGQDRRMQEVYTILCDALSDDQKICGFISAASGAIEDYSVMRDRKKRAVDLAKDISKAAGKLTNLLQQFATVGLPGPDEFRSVRALLQNTDNHEMGGHNFHMWRALRGDVLGKSPTDNTRRQQIAHKTHEGEETAPCTMLEVRILESGERPARSKAEEALHYIYVWGTSPPVPALLDTLATAALNFDPRERGRYGAALRSRQSSKKTEYLRVFGHLLQDERLISLSTPLMNAMAITANVAINQPNVDVSYDDVRKALGPAS